MSGMLVLNISGVFTAKWFTYDGEKALVVGFRYGFPFATASEARAKCRC